MAERGILMSGPMVRATLDGTKTVTRRVVKPQPDPVYRLAHQHSDGSVSFFVGPTVESRSWGVGPIRCPYGRAGDYLYVRETFVQGWPVENMDTQDCDEDGNDLPMRTWYAADGDLTEWLSEDGYEMVDRIPWKPSIHMPKALARIWLRVTDMRVERVQDITHFDALAEGVPTHGWGHQGDYVPSVNGFAHLWDSLNASRGYGWGVNPWVWVVEFERCERSEAGR